MKVVLNVLSFIQNGEPAGTRTQGPRLKRAMLYRLSYRLTGDDGMRNRRSGATGITQADDTAAS